MKLSQRQKRLHQAFLRRLSSHCSQRRVLSARAAKTPIARRKRDPVLFRLLEIFPAALANRASCAQEPPEKLLLFARDFYRLIVRMGRMGVHSF